MARVIFWFGVWVFDFCECKDLFTHISPLSLGILIGKV